MRLSRTLHIEQMEHWARLTSDFNPMHLDPEFTRQTAYGRPIVYATLTLAIVSEALERQFGNQWIEGGSLDVRFVDPVSVGDEFSVSIENANGNAQVTCHSGDTSPLVLSLTLANDKSKMP